MEWELDRELYALPGFRCEQILPMVLVVCKTCRNSRLFHVLAAGLVWRGDDAGHEIVRQALILRLLDTSDCRVPGQLPRRRYGPTSHQDPAYSALSEVVHCTRSSSACSTGDFRGGLGRPGTDGTFS